MDHMILFGGSAVAIAHMSESGVPESSSFESSGMESGASTSESSTK